MANVLNRTTKEFIASINTPDYPPSDYIINPDMTAVAGYPDKYWDINGDIVTLKDEVSRTVIDATEDAAVKLQTAVDAATVATKALADSGKVVSPAGGATLEERVRALELKVYGG